MSSTTSYRFMWRRGDPQEEARKLRWIMQRMEVMEKKISLKWRCIDSKLWLNDDEREMFIASPIEPSSIPEAKSTAATFLMTAIFLEDLAMTLRDASSMMQHAIQSSIYNHGLACLPTEILANITELCPDKDGLTYRDVQLVCRRFRSVALEHAPLWSVLSNHMCRKQVDLHLTRCKAVGLRFDLKLTPDWEPDIHEYEQLLQLVETSHRWKEANIELRLMECITHGQCERLLNSFRLDTLERLVITSDDSDDGVNGLLQTWTMPSLRHLECSLPILRHVKLEGSLVSLDLKCDGNIDIREIAKFFGSRVAASLVHLSITFANIERGSDTTTGEEGIQVATLKQLRTFRLEVYSSGRYYSEIVRQAVWKLDVPSVEEIRISAFESTIVEIGMSRWLEKQNRNPKLRRVRMKVTNSNIRNLLTYSFGSSLRSKLRIRRVEDSHDTFMRLPVACIEPPDSDTEWDW